MKSSKYIFLVLFLFVMACETYEQEDYEQSYVVEAYLIANRQLPQVRLSKTAPAFEFYSFENTAVEGATVQINLVNPGGSPETFLYSSDSAGIYTPAPGVSHNVLPLRTYQLFITIPNTPEEIRAEVVVPDTFQIISTVDTLIYQSSEQLEITVTENSYPGRQNIFVFNALVQEPSFENLTPAYAEFIDDEDEEDLISLQNNSSGVINEANFDRNPNGSITIRYPWIGIAFFGENQIVTNTLDDNIYDFFRSWQVQLGGSTLSPGEIQNPIYNIEGAIGVFGAMASDTTTAFIRRPDGF